MSTFHFSPIGLVPSMRLSRCIFSIKISVLFLRFKEKSNRIVGLTIFESTCAVCSPKTFTAIGDAETSNTTARGRAWRLPWSPLTRESLPHRAGHRLSTRFSFSSLPLRVGTVFREPLQGRRGDRRQALVRGSGFGFCGWWPQRLSHHAPPRPR